MIQKILNWWRAWRYGETRIAPAGVRGRVYERTGGDSGVRAKARPEAKMSVRVFRESENAWYRQNPVTSKFEKE